MALDKLNKNMQIISALSDEPNDVDGLTSAQLKAKFDEAGEAIKAYINNVLLPQLEGHGAAASIGARPIGELTGETVQAQIDQMLTKFLNKYPVFKAVWAQDTDSEDERTKSFSASMTPLGMGIAEASNHKWLAAFTVGSQPDGTNPEGYLVVASVDDSGKRYEGRITVFGSGGKSKFYLDAPMGYLGSITSYGDNDFVPKKYVDGKVADKATKEYAKVYSVSGTTITFVSNIYADSGTAALNKIVSEAAFSPDGSTLIIGSDYDWSGYTKVYTVSGTTVTYIGDIYGYCCTIAFAPDGDAVVLSRGSNANTSIHSVNGTTITKVSDIYADNGTTALNGYVETAVFSPDGSLLVLGGAFDGRAKAYSVNGTTIAYSGKIYADNGTTALSGMVNVAAFSPDGSLLVLGGGFSGYAKVYSVSGTTVTFVSDVSGAGNTVYGAGLSGRGHLGRRYGRGQRGPSDHPGKPGGSERHRIRPGCACG